jgi:glutaredoxin
MPVCPGAIGLVYRLSSGDIELTVGGRSSTVEIVRESIPEGEVLQKKIVSRYRGNGQEERMSTVAVYGADWCGDTQRTRRYLDHLGVAYHYINVEQDKQASEWVKQQNDGKERKPTVKIGEQVLAEPSDQALEYALRQEGLVP